MRQCVWSCKQLGRHVVSRLHSTNRYLCFTLRRFRVAHGRQRTSDIAGEGPPLSFSAFLLPPFSPPPPICRGSFLIKLALKSFYCQFGSVRFGRTLDSSFVSAVSVRFATSRPISNRKRFLVHLMRIYAHLATRSVPNLAGY